MKYLFLLLTGSTLFFSLAPGHFTPPIFGDNDKLAHFVVFFGLSFGLNFTFSDCSSKMLFFIMVMLAGCIEILQGSFTNRELSVFDFAASTLGVFVFLISLRVTRQIKVVVNALY